MAFPAAPTESGGAKLHFLTGDDNTAAGWFQVDKGTTGTGSNVVGFAAVATHVHDDAAGAPGGLATTSVPIVLGGAVRDDALGGLSPAQGDAVYLLVDGNGALWTHDNALDAALSGSELQVDIVGSLPAGTAAIGKLAANDGVDIGDVTVNNAAGSGAYVQPGTSTTWDVSDRAARDLGKVDIAAFDAALPVGSNLIGEVDINSVTPDLMLGSDFINVFGTASVVDGSNHVQVDIAADSVGIGGGTQYTDDTDTHSSGSSVGNLLIAAATPTDGSVDANDLGAVAMSLDRRLHVDAQIVGTDSALDVSGATVPVSNAGLTELAGAINASQMDTNLAASDLDIMLGSDFSDVFGTASVVAGNEVQVDIVGALPAGSNNIGDVDVATVPAPLNVVGGGTQATALRVTIASDSTGVISVDDNSGSLTVDNGGTFAVQEDGSALTALELIDDPVFADDAAFTLTSSKVSMAGAIRDDTLGTLDAAEGDAVPLRVNSTGALHVTGAGGGTQYQVDDALGATPTGTLALVTRDDTLSTLSEAEGDAVPLRVNSVGALHVTGGGGGTEYTDDTSTHSSGSSQGGLIMAAATPTDTSVDANDIGALAMSTDRRLLVDAQIVGADSALDVSAATVPISHAALTELAAAINTNELDVNIATDSVGIGGGVQYDVDDPLGATPTGTLALARRDDALGGLTPVENDAIALRVDANGALWTHDDALDAALSGSELQVDVVASLPAGDNNIGNVDIVTVPAPLSVTGGGTESTALRVTIANDSTGVISVDDGDGSLTVDNAALTELAAAINTNRVDVNVDAATLDLMLGSDFTSVFGTASVVAGNELQVDIVGVTPDLMLGTDFSSVFGSGSVVSATPAVKVEEQGTVTVDLGANNDVVVAGDAAHDASDSGNPVKIGGYAYGGTPTAVGAGDRVNAMFDEYGRLGVMGGVDDDFLYADINDASSGDNTIVAAAGAGKRIAVWSVLVVSDGTVDVRFEDGAGGTAFTGQIPLQTREGFSYSAGGLVPLWKGTANTLLNLELSAPVNVHGHVSYTILDD